MITLLKVLTWIPFFGVFVEGLLVYYYNINYQSKGKLFIPTMIYHPVVSMLLLYVLSITIG